VVFQSLPADHKGHLARVVGKMQGRLTSRVSGADEINVQSMRGVGFATCGPVIDTLADEPIEAIDSEATPRDARCQNESACPDDIVAIEEHFAHGRIDASDGAGD